jgi:predicted ribosome quality control (RQC) complex YloA/Tae2 family protein
MVDGGGTGARYRTYDLDGHQILVGKSARDNDHLTFRVARPADLWLHASGYAGSHVLVRQPSKGDPPRAVIEAAAQLAAFHSKARAASGKVDVHVCRAGDVRKRPGSPAGQVVVRRGEVMKVYVRNPFGEDGVDSAG